MPLAYKIYLQYTQKIQLDSGHLQEDVDFL